MTRKVLFLCTGNSCRSQMAEAIVNQRLKGDWQAFSAGTHPAEVVNPITIHVLSEIGIEHRGTSKSVDEFRNQPFDVVVTVCDSAAEECPVWLGQGTRKHIGFTDPSKAEGNDDEVLEAFRSVRDQIATQILAYLGSI